MCRAFRTSGEFRYTLGAVELVQGGSIRTFFRATGIRNRFWESQESHCHRSGCFLPLLPTTAQTGQTEAAHSPAARAPWLTCRQENLSGIRMKELPRSCVMR